MSRKNILVVEDDKHISKLLTFNLEKSGFGCTAVVTGEEALTILNRESFDLILLDIMLPNMDGLETCRCIKHDKKTSNIFFI